MQETKGKQASLAIIREHKYGFIHVISLHYAGEQKSFIPVPFSFHENFHATSGYLVQK